MEVLNENKYSTMSDVWAYGVVCWEIMTDGQTPYGDSENLIMVAEHITSGSMLPQPPSCPTAVYVDMMTPCWNLDPMARPSFSELLHRAQTLGGVMMDRLGVGDDLDAVDDSMVNRHSRFLPTDEADHEGTAWSGGSEKRANRAYTLSGVNPMFDPQQIYEDVSDGLPNAEEDDCAPLL